MNSPLTSYLSLQYENEEEQKYIAGLIDQFELAKMADSYHLAIFAYHLLFICYFYQTLHKIKIWMPDKHHIAMVSLDKERRIKFREAKNPTDYAHNENKESSLFEFLNIFCDCHEIVAKCKNLVKYRNIRLGHVNYLLVSEESFEKQIEEYEQVALEIHNLTHSELAKIFDEYFKSIDPEIEQTKDNIEIDLIAPNRFSNQDLQRLASECLISTDFKKDLVSKILQDDFGIYVELAK
ncbi:MAG: hypothetical protein NTV98_05135 [Candidatus Roizmanbacteria bacterium]|nr:hypothetical protein [Candidatus Roizmanbacteria bacterium]